MKILRLDLRAFGPFTDMALDLSGGHEGLHVIYGPNEAGKSSALRAVEQLLFGIPSRSSDDFLHSYQNLRIGAALATRDGQTLEFLRRKGAKNTLLAPDGLTPVDDGALRPFLNGIDRELFGSMFGIGHEQLVRGGKEIASGQGDLGQVLFATGSGIADLQAIRQRLEGRAEELFTRRGNRQINQKLKALDDARKAIRQQQLSSAEWDEHDQRLRDASQRLAQVEARLRELAREKSRLERLARALPLIAKWNDRRRELDALGDVPRLGSRFADQRRKVVTDLAVAQRAAQSAAEELDPIERQLASIVVPAELLDCAERIEELPDLLGSHRKAKRDLPGLRAERDHLGREAASILRQLRPDLSLDVAEQLRLTSPRKLAIQNLGSRSEALLRQIEQVRKAIDEAEKQRAEAQAELAGLESGRDPASLVAALQSVQEQGKLEVQRAAIAENVRQTESQSAIDLSKLGLWSGTLDALEQLAVPLAETIERHDQALAEAERRVTSLEERLDEASRQKADADRQIEQLRLEGDVPTEDALVAARRLRDEGWQRVLEAWQQGHPNADRLKQFLARADAGSDLAAAYRQTVEAADELSDRLRREAHRVATRANLQATRDALEQQTTALEKSLATAQAGRQAADAAWQECWREAGVRPQSPREMRAWLRRHAALVEQSQVLRRLRDQLRETDARIESCRQELGRCLVALGEPGPAEQETLAALVARGRKVVEHVQSVAERRQTLDKEIRQAGSRQAAAREEAARAEADLKAWRQQWAEAIEPFGLSPESLPAVVNDFITRLDDLFAKLKEAANLDERIAGIDRDAEAFGAFVAELAGQVAADLASLPVEHAAEKIHERLRQARADQQRQRELAQKRARHREQLQAARGTIAELEDRLRSMCQEARCPGPDQLPEAIQAAEAAARLREGLAELEDQLFALGGGASLESLLAESAAVHADDLPGMLSETAAEFERLEEEKAGLQKIVWEEQHTLGAIDASSQAAEAAQQVQDLLAQVQTEAQEYACLRLASAVLREGIQRYQQKNEDPVLRRASELFRRLTLGSFERLSTDFGEQDQKVLVGVRPGGNETVGLAGMSEGTCDQLYLALRLASLETYLADKEPVPFIVDDVLVSFDDDRSAATLEVLAEFSERTQILFFTHHQHLVGLAETRLAPSVLFVHRLAAEKRPVEK